jgi:acyl-CoA synthetase (AMP-forming)/AMP-acid ligase II
MVKKRGYRIELGEIEACLYRHPDVREAAVIALPDTEAGIHVRAHLSLHEGRKASLIALKTFCAGHLPAYMIPDTFAFHTELKRTSTDEVDYQWLKNLGLNSPA